MDIRADFERRFNNLEEGKGGYKSMYEVMNDTFYWSYDAYFLN